MSLAAPKPIGEGEKFAILALRGQGPAFDKPVYAGDGVEVWPTLPLMIPQHWESFPGTHTVRHFQRCNLWIVSRRQATSPDQDLELLAVARRVNRLHFGLIAATPAFYTLEGWFVQGRFHDGAAYANNLSASQPAFHAPGFADRTLLHPNHVREAEAIAEGMLETHAVGDYDRLGRVNFALMQAHRARDMTTRFHQCVRVLEGLVFPPQDMPTGPTFADRTKLFFGTQHKQLLEELYVMRGKVEHLHGPEAAVSEVRPGLSGDEAILHFAYATFLTEFMAKACVTRVYTRPKLWRHFENDAALRAFWESTPRKRDLWGSEFDLETIARSFDKDRAARDLKAGTSQDQPGEKADDLARAWATDNRNALQKQRSRR